MLNRLSFVVPLQRTTLGMFIAALGLAGCSNLPDQRLANDALRRGDTSLAEQNYQQLADRGFVDAKVGIADMQVESGDPAQIAKAEATYRASLDQSPRAQARLGRLLATKPHPSEANKKEAESLLKRGYANGEMTAMLSLTMLYLQYPRSFPGVDPQKVVDDWKADGIPEAQLAQILIYRVKGTYDQHLPEIEGICLRALATDDICYIELATVYQKQANTAKLAALVTQLQAAVKVHQAPAERIDGIARIMIDPTLGKPDPKSAKAMLELNAPAYPASWVSLAQLLYDFPELGNLQTMMQYLNNGRAADQSRANLLLGKLYYEGKWVPQDPFTAEKYLYQAAPTQIGAHYYLGQIYRRGYLGHVYPQKAVDNLLTAARGGQNSADFALAQLFSVGRGTLPNPLNAYVFSQLSLNRGNPLADQLAQTLNQQLPAADRAQAQQLIQQERRLRVETLPQTPEIQALQEKDGEVN